MKKILIVTIRIISVLMLIPPILLAIPGVILNILSEELDDASLSDDMKKYYSK